MGRYQSDRVKRADFYLNRYRYNNGHANSHGDGDSYRYSYCYTDSDKYASYATIIGRCSDRTLAGDGISIPAEYPAIGA